MTEVTAMIHKSIKTAGFLAVLFLFFFTGCTAGEHSRPLMWYGEESFPFEMTVPADSGSILLTGERTPCSVTLTVTSPESIQGLTVQYENGNCVLTAGSSVIPLSKSAAQGLTCLLDGLLLSSAEGAQLGSDSEGLTTVTFPPLTLTLDENGLPCGVFDADSGRTAAISVSAEDVTDEKNTNKTDKDQQSNEYQNENNGGDLRVRPDP